jgi:hypothetical protein
MSRIAVFVAGVLTLPSVLGAQLAPSRSSRPDSLLDLLVGEWEMAGAVRGKPARYTLHAERVLQNKYVELHMMTDVATHPTYEARVIIGMAAKPGEYIAHWIDNTGAQYSVPAATGTQSGDTLYLDFPYPDGAFHDTFAYDRATGVWHFKLEAADGKGGWVNFADYLVRPAKSR